MQCPCKAIGFCGAINEVKRLNPMKVDFPPMARPPGSGGHGGAAARWAGRRAGTGRGQLCGTAPAGCSLRCRDAAGSISPLGWE